MDERVDDPWTLADFTDEERVHGVELLQDISCQDDASATVDQASDQATTYSSHN